MFEKSKFPFITVSALLSCVVAFFFMVQDIPAAENSSRSDKLCSIEVVLKARANPPDFWRIVEQGISMAAEEFTVNCNVTGPTTESDVAGQIELVYQAIARRPDALILAAGDYKQLVPACEYASDMGIPVIILDSDVDTEERVCFVGTDNFELGQKMGELVDSLIGTEERFGIIGHVENTYTAMRRRDGLLGSIKNSESRLAALSYCDSFVEVARRQTIDMLKAHPDIKCIVGLNESSALGISTALNELGLSGEIVVVACDSSRQQIQFLENNTIQAVVIQNPFNMGYLSVKAAVESLGGNKPENVINTGSIVITKEDMYKIENQKLLFPFTET